MMSVSTSIRLDMMREILGMKSLEFSRNLIDWAVDFGFIIDGDYIRIAEIMLKYFL